MEQLATSITDNISELLVKILEFTRARHMVLAENIKHLHDPDFEPRDLPVAEFASLMEQAVCEHRRSGRILLQDTKGLKFGSNGVFSARPEVDRCAGTLFRSDMARYLELQKRKLMENTANYRVAGKLLRQKQAALQTACN